MLLSSKALLQPLSVVVKQSKLLRSKQLNLIYRQFPCYGFCSQKNNNKQTVKTKREAFKSSLGTLIALNEKNGFPVKLEALENKLKDEGWVISQGRCEISLNDPKQITVQVGKQSQNPLFIIATNKSEKYKSIEVYLPTNSFRVLSLNNEHSQVSSNKVRNSRPLEVVVRLVLSSNQKLVTGRFLIDGDNAQFVGCFFQSAPTVQVATQETKIVTTDTVTEVPPLGQQVKPLKYSPGPNIPYSGPVLYTLENPTIQAVQQIFLDANITPATLMSLGQLAYRGEFKKWSLWLKDLDAMV